MSGSRSNPPGTSDRASLDALSRTIEGLEARIEGLIGSTAGRDPRQRTAVSAHAPGSERNDPQGWERTGERAPSQDREAYGGSRYERPSYAHAAADVRQDPQSAPPAPADHLADIRQRQRTLAASRDRSLPRHDDVPPRQPSPARSPADAMTEIAQALVSLRQDLKHDIAEGVAREMGSLREEIRTIRGHAEDQDFAEDMRQDLARLSTSIDQLAKRGGHPQAAAELKSEFDGLRSLMDGLAREESVRGFEQRWDRIEDRLQTIDTEGLQGELLALAYRIDDIKRQLGGMGQSPAVHALEEKLISIATAMEQLGSLMQPHDRAMSQQFSAIDARLDEISRAIVASGRIASPATDPAMMQRLDGRIASLADQIDLLGREAERRQQPAEHLASRIEALTSRIEEMSHAAAVTTLGERLDQLSFMMERAQTPAAQPDLTHHLADISRKIDALEFGSVNDALAERLDYLARRIDEMDLAARQPALGGDVAQRLEGRLSDIAKRLEQSTAAAPSDSLSLRNLEEQIAHLSALMSEPRESGDAFHVDFDRRMSALEGYMSTNDEYIVEAARQAAETVVEAYSRNGALQSATPLADMSVLTGLAEDLRNLEDLSRDSDTRTHRTFAALHDTLVHIADRLDEMEQRQQPPRAAAAEDFHAGAYREMAAAEPAAAAASPAWTQPVIRAPAPAEVSARIEEPAPPVASMDAAAKAGVKAEAGKERAKSGLLAGFGKRFRSARKQAPAAAAADRPLIDPAPSIDPVEVVQGEGPDELLEPGSGAPDIRKILERVRVSQSAARNSGTSPQAEAERADYIAAARRAAQAAAMEVDQTQRLSSAAKGGEIKGGSAFARYRRPIMLAVGAALLAIMAFPLVHTLTQGHNAPPSAETTAMHPSAGDPATDADAVATQPATQASDNATADGGAATTAAASVEAPPATVAAPAPAATDDHTAGAVPPASDAATEGATPSAAPAPDTSAAAPADAPKPDAMAAPVPPAPDQAAAIVVPDVIQPQSLADAARKGDPVALFEIGSRYTDGRGVPADFKQAANWYQLSADKGFAPAQYRLASMYEKGGGVERDLAKAKQYYEQAANQGNASSMHNLAVLFASGTIGPQDYNAAASWFIKAANLGVADSQFNLAILYARGNGVTQDLEESYKWFAIAAMGGDKDAAQKRDEVAAALKPAQLQSARTKVDQWKPQPVDDKTNRADIPDEWGGKGVHTASIDMKKAIRNIQAILNNNGFDAGQPDGQMGAKTVSALKSFQKSVGIEPDGKVTDKVVKELLARNTTKK